jgi:GNAT superfamily N-acetyltransferase
MRVRTMTNTDIPEALRLKEIAGWNQTGADWQRFLEASPEGCFVAELDERVRGTVTTISFENQVAWVGMVLVDPEYRGRGIGTKLLQRAIEHLDHRRIPAIKLDATPQGKPLYEKLGFTSEYEIGRWILQRPSTGTMEASCSGLHPSLSSEFLESILKTDREVFGANRGFLLQSLHDDAPDFTMGIWNDGILEGYALGRRGSFADHLGPWVAANGRSARRLLEEFLARSSRETVLVDCLKSNTNACELLPSFGFSYSRPLTRMYRRSNHCPGRTDILCAILGPEFG